MFYVAKIRKRIHSTFKFTYKNMYFKLYSPITHLEYHVHWTCCPILPHPLALQNLPLSPETECCSVI